MASGVMEASPEEIQAVAENIALQFEDTHPPSWRAAAADVAWLSEERFSRVRDEAACSVAPEICVEIMSASNTEQEMRDKRALYLEAGALEVWICGEDGGMRFFDQAGERESSALVSGFPGRVQV